MKNIYTTLLFAGLISLFATGQSTQLTVRGFSEGYYNPATGKMRAVIDPVGSPLIADTGTIELIDPLTNQTVECYKTPVNTDGFATVSVPPSLTGQSFTVSIKFRNTFHLLSASPILLNAAPLLVDLSIPSTTCCNFDSTNGVAKAFCGDVNFDGAIDVSDATIWEYDYHNNPSGYNITDVTGDQIVDTLDYYYMEEHSNTGAFDDYFSNCMPVITSITNPEMVSFSVYPNPASGNVRITTKFSHDGDMLLRIISMTGAEVRVIEWKNNTNEISFNAGELTPGIYFLLLNSEAGISHTQKLVVE